MAEKSESRILPRESWRIRWNRRPSSARPSKRVETCTRQGRESLKEMNYQPNVYASALAYNKSYTFYLLIPKHESEAYWEEIEEGAKKM